MADPLYALLDNYQYTTLLRIADSNGIAATTADGRRLPKRAVIKALLEQLVTQDHSMQALAHLGDLDRAVLHRLMLHGGRVATDVLRDELQHEGIVQAGSPQDSRSPYKGDPFNPDAHAMEDVIARLTLRGLVFSSGIPQSWQQRELSFTPGLALIVPQPVLSHLLRSAPPPVTWGPGDVPAGLDKTSTATAQRELFIYWSCVRDQPLLLTRAGAVRKRALRSINRQLLSGIPSLARAGSETDFARLFFMRLVLQELGVLIQQDNQVKAAGRPNVVPEFWQQSVEERTKASLEAWVGLQEWGELSSLSLSSFRLDLPGARRTVLEQFRMLPPGVWLSSERFLSRLSVVAPGLLFHSRDYLDYGTRYYQDLNHRTDQSHRLAEIQGAFACLALSGPLHWLGIVDVSLDGNRLLAFRINASGARALDMASGENVPGDMQLATGSEFSLEASLVVQPNFEILALGPVPEATLARLEMFAQRVKVDRSAFGYMLSRETVYRGEQDGVPVREILAFLEQACSVPVPRNVTRTLQEWGEQHRRIVFHRDTCLCEAARAELLQQLWDDSALHAHLERRLSPTVAMVKKGRLAALQEALLRQDLLPVSSSARDGCAGRVQATPEGELRPVHEGPDLLLKGCLGRLAEERDGRFYVTEDAVNHALGSGMSVQGYLDQLATLHRGPVPAALQRRVKAWGTTMASRHFGKPRSWK
jgi:hypothetical protein